MNPHQVTRDFELALCEYTGAPYAVAVTSCTMALLLAVAWHVEKRKPVSPIALRPEIEIPKRTYVSVPQSIIHAGGRPVFRDSIWFGAYQLKPLPVWDSARYFTSGMYYSKLWNTELQPHEPGIHSVDGSGAMLCVSFHTSKILADTQGGAILHDSAEADAWLRRARFDGRTEGVAPKDDRFDMLGWHCYLSPDVAARLMWKLSVLPKHNEPLPNDAYPDLSQMEIFR
jgi:dTDP-4-amino-4,6-dideoxygalactose transaminase